MEGRLKKDMATNKENWRSRKFFICDFLGGENSTTEPPMLLSMIFDDVGKMRGYKKKYIAFI